MNEQDGNIDLGHHRLEKIVPLCSGLTNATGQHYKCDVCLSNRVDTLDANAKAIEQSPECRSPRSWVMHNEHLKGRIDVALNSHGSGNRPPKDTAVLSGTPQQLLHQCIKLKLTAPICHDGPGASLTINLVANCSVGI